MHVPHGSGPIVAASRDISRRSVVVGFGFAGIAAALAAAGWKVDVLAQGATPADATQPTEDLNAVEVIYGHPEDPAAFQDYLLNVHTPLVEEVPGIEQRIVRTSVVGIDGTPSDIYMMATIVWASQAALESALVSEEGQVAFADVVNFATGGYTAYMAHVAFLTPPDGSATPEASPGA
jgi:uncharacterized protein (TIGR02118 family)